ncbi:MAG: hypothetical protein DRP70_12700 [Spirochaetes bacterium]|nr:MAG: hypothetical protein DRP70_12700 [Spirochaetota bacterium]
MQQTDIRWFLSKTLLLLMVFSSTFSIDAQEETGRIRIAFMGLEPRNGYEQVEIVTDYLRTEIIKTGTFEIVERTEIDKIISEMNFQSSGLIDTASNEDLINIGKFASVKLLLMGSIGTMENKTTVTVRLVDAETARIVFANAVVNRPGEGIEDGLVVLARKISESGLQTITEPSLEKIEQARSAGNPSEALLYARKLMEESPSAENAWLVEELRGEAALSVYKQARKSLRHRAWNNAVILTDEAILLDPQPQYYDFRFQALAAREDALQRDALEREKLLRKEQQRREQEAAGIYTVGDQVRNYYKGIHPAGWRLGYSSGVYMNPDLSIGDAFAWSGGELTYVNIFKSGPPWISQAWSAGMTVESKDSGFGDKDLIFSALFSPFTTFYFGGGNFYFIPSFDIGAFFLTGPTTGNTGGFSATVQGAVELKFWRSIGIYGTIRIEYDWFPSRAELSGVHPRWSAGIVL